MKTNNFPLDFLPLNFPNLHNYSAGVLYIQHVFRKMVISFGTITQKLGFFFTFPPIQIGVKQTNKTSEY